MLGIGYAWSIQYARIPAYLEEMGMSDTLMGLTFIAGPVSGAIVQPIVGVLSDSCTHRLGRRRPFIIVGTATLIVTYLIISNSFTIGSFLGDRSDSSFRVAGCLVASISFWFADLGINVLQLPCRTLISDVLPPEDVTEANALFAVWDGIGKTTSYALGSVSLAVPALAMAGDTEFALDVRIQFLISIVLMIVCMGIGVACVHEKPLPRTPKHGKVKTGFRSQMQEVVSKFRDALFSDRAELETVQQVFKVCALFWYAMCVWQIYGPIYMGKEIWRGDPHGPDCGEGAEEEEDEECARYLFEAGVRGFSRSLSIANFLSMCAALTVPYLMKSFGSGRLWGASIVFTMIDFAALFAVPFTFHSTAYRRFFATLAMSLLGLPWSVFLTIPYALVLRTYSDNPDKGLFMAVMNMGLCLGQLLVTLASPLLLLLAGGRMPILFIVSVPVLAAGAHIASFIQPAWEMKVPSDSQRYSQVELSEMSDGDDD